MTQPKKITIWIAARNEEDNIINCLESIDKLNYPKEYLQVLIGNDQSEDNTKSIVENYINNFSEVPVVMVGSSLAARLKIQGSDNCIYNLSLGGDSALTGLNIINWF